MITLCILTCQKHKLYSVSYKSIIKLNFKRVSTMPNQPIKLQNVEYEMLLELAKKARMKPDQYLSNIINQQYNNKK